MVKFLLPLLSTLLTVALFTPLILYITRRYKLFALPREDSIHKEPMPLYGGAAIYIAVTLSYIVLAIYGTVHGTEYVPRLLALIVAGTIIFISGLLDDRYNLKWWWKISFQLGAVGILIVFGYKLEFYAYPIVLGGVDINPYLRVPMMVLWMLVVTNATNLIDGLDGLCAGVVGISSLSVAVLALIRGDTLFAYLMLSLTGACAGFLFYNFHPAKIFMGDTGSLFLGFTFAGIATIENMKTSAMTAILVPIIAFALPIIDILFAVIRRSGSKRKISDRDTDHYFHKLLKLGLSHRNTVLMTYALTVILGVISIIFNYSSLPVKHAILILLTLIFSIFLYMLEYLKPTGTSTTEDE